MKMTELFPDVITEDCNYEYKAELSETNPIKWAKTIVGYANGKGGIIFIGVSNEGEAFGLSLEAIDKTKLLISRINDRHIFPHVKYSCMIRSTDDEAEKFVLGVKVAPSESVVRYRDGDYNETVYVRGDGNTTVATPEEIISLGKRKYGIDNETTPIHYNEKDWSEYIELCRQYREDQSVPTLKELQNEEIVSAEGYAKSGFIMFADSYNNDDTMICCRLWKGKNKTGVVLDNARLKGSIPWVFTEVLSFIERNTRTGWVKTAKGGRKEIRSYPVEAVREALVNAIAHRDYAINGTQIDVDIYSDRIEIVSPGSWLLPKAYEEYPVGSIPSIRRNSIIAAALDTANLTERGGTGFQTMMRAYIGSPDEIQPVVSIYPGFLRLQLFDKLYNDEAIDLDLDNLTESEKVIALLRMEGPQSIRELQKKLNYNSRSIFLKEVINPMLDEGKIYRDGKPKSPTALIKLKRKTGTYGVEP